MFGNLLELLRDINSIGNKSRPKAMRDPPILIRGSLEPDLLFPFQNILLNNLNLFNTLSLIDIFQKPLKLYHLMNDLLRLLMIANTQIILTRTKGLN
jgi:hypothetical protein